MNVITYLMSVILSVPDECYYVPDECYFERTWWMLFWAYLMNVITYLMNVILSVPDECYYVPDECYSRSASCALTFISVFIIRIQMSFFNACKRNKMAHFKILCMELSPLYIEMHLFLLKVIQSSTITHDK